MPRIRSVHPDICTDEVMAEVSAEAERLFVRLWTHLDDDGRCVDNPKLLKAALFPLADEVTPESIALWLTELVEKGLLARYTAGERSFLTAKPEAWHRWQKPRRRVESKLPGPECADIVRTAQDIARQRPAGGGAVGGGGDGDGLGAEGESEGEVGAPRLRAVPVDNDLTRRCDARARAGEA